MTAPLDAQEADAAPASNVVDALNVLPDERSQAQPEVCPRCQSAQARVTLLTHYARYLQCVACGNDWHLDIPARASWF